MGHQMKDESVSAAVEIVGASVAGKTAYAGAGATVASWLVSSEAGIVLGVLVGVLGLIANFVFQKRRDRREQHFRERQDAREQREHDARMRALGLTP